MRALQLILLLALGCAAVVLGAGEAWTASTFLGHVYGVVIFVWGFWILTDVEQRAKRRQERLQLAADKETLREIIRRQDTEARGG